VSDSAGFGIRHIPTLNKFVKFQNFTFSFAKPQETGLTNGWDI